MFYPSQLIFASNRPIRFDASCVCAIYARIVLFSELRRAGMPRRCFDIRGGRSSSCDEFGITLPTIEQAHGRAFSPLPDMARDERPGGQAYDSVWDMRKGSERVVDRAKLKAGEIDEAATRLETGKPRTPAATAASR